MRSLIYIERIFNRFGDFLGWLSSILFILLLLNVVYDVVMRYVFNDVSIAFQEMEWHLFSAVFLLGVPYAIKSGGHVRVDIFMSDCHIKRNPSSISSAPCFSSFLFVCWSHGLVLISRKRVMPWARRLVTQVVCRIDG